MKRVALALMLALGASACYAPVVTPLPDPARTLVGCYRLERGAWDVEPESLLIGLPGPALRLRASRGPSIGFNNGPEIPEASWRAELPKQYDGVAAWWVAGADTLIVTTGGLFGIAMYLNPVSADTLRGQAVAYTDILQRDSTGELRSTLARAPLIAEREACEHPAAAT